MDPNTLRLELLKILVPHAAKVGLTDPDIVISKAKQFEAYVLPPVDSAPKIKQTKGRKKEAPSPE